MAEYQERVIEEKAELDIKCLKLAAFKKTPVFLSLDEISRDLMEKQFNLMCAYSDVLEERILRFFA
jgi:hypothetical protein